MTINIAIYLLIGAIAFIVLLKLLFFLDKVLRLPVLIHTRAWQDVDYYSPNMKNDFPGIYIWQKKGAIFWKTVYVGQSVKVHRRFKQHISGKGSPQIYKDFKNKKVKLRYKCVSITETHYKSLDALERRVIKHYKTYSNGYNKTSGNGKKYY